MYEDMSIEELQKLVDDNCNEAYWQRLGDDDPCNYCSNIYACDVLHERQAMIKIQKLDDDILS